MKFSNFIVTVALMIIALTGCSHLSESSTVYGTDEAVQTFESIEESKTDNSATDSALGVSGKKLEYSVAGDDHVHDWSVIERTVSSGCTSDVSVLKECLLCGLQKMETVAGEGHDYKEVAVEATCKSAGCIRYICTKCGEFYDTDQTALLEHAETSVVEQQADCEIDGVVKRYCEVCGDILEYKSIKAVGHDWVLTGSGVACRAGAVSEYACSRCKKTKTIALSGTHVWSQWKVITEATCEREGLKGRTCSACGEYEKQTIDKLKHLESAWKVKKAATCTATGLKVKTCTVCGQVVSKSVIAMLEHAYGECIVDKSASCKEKGSQYRKCVNCGEQVCEEIDKTDHCYEWITERAATCTQKGLKVYKCTVCGEQSKAEDVDTVSHYMIDIPTVSVKESCTAEGYSVYPCRNCSYTETVRYPALGHYWECQDEMKVCARCGMSKVDG